MSKLRNERAWGGRKPNVQINTRTRCRIWLPCTMIPLSLQCLRPQCRGRWNDFVGRLTKIYSTELLRSRHQEEKRKGKKHKTCAKAATGKQEHANMQKLVARWLEPVPFCNQIYKAFNLLLPVSTSCKCIHIYIYIINCKLKECQESEFSPESQANPSPAAWTFLLQPEERLRLSKASHNIYHWPRWQTIYQATVSSPTPLSPSRPERYGPRSCHLTSVSFFRSNRAK